MIEEETEYTVEVSASWGAILLALTSVAFVIWLVLR